MSDIVARIDAWESAGLIDTDTAARLRAAEGATSPKTPSGATAAPAPPARPAGPAISTPTAPISEMFAYLGSAFVIAAYTTFASRIADSSSDRDAILTGASALLTIVVILIGAWLARGDDRSRRGAGMLLLVAVAGASFTANFLTQALGWSWGAGPELFVAAVTLVVAVAVRAFRPALTTHFGLLAAVTLAGGVLLDVAKRAIEGRLTDSVGGGYDPDIVPRVANLTEDVLLPLAGWLVVALVLGLIGLYEARRDTPPADARASFSRFWAGLVAVTGTWSAVSTSGYLGPERWDRVLEPWIGDVILGAVVVVLVERAIRRDAIAYVLPAAIGLIAALTDLNFRYLADSTEVGLLVEGAILLAVGFAADRVRRRLSRMRSPATTAPPPAPPSPPADQPAAS